MNLQALYNNDISFHMKKMQSTLSWIVVGSQVGHLYCCVLPGIFSIMTLLTGMGLVGALPIWAEELHHVMHDWEKPLLIGSAIVLALGWIIQVVSWRIDCRDTGCAHNEPCAPKKNRSARILVFATILFVVNIVIFFGFHG